MLTVHSPPQLMLNPRIEAINIFGNSPPGEIRLHTYRQMRCNETYYRVNDDPELQDPCDQFYKAASVVLYDGAEGIHSDMTQHTLDDATPTPISSYRSATGALMAKKKHSAHTSRMSHAMARRLRIALLTVLLAVLHVSPVVSADCNQTNGRTQRLRT